MPASNGNAIGLDFARLDSLVRVFVGVDPQLHRRRWAGEAIRIENYTSLGGAAKVPITGVKHCRATGHGMAVNFKPTAVSFLICPDAVIFWSYFRLSWALTSSVNKTNTSEPKPRVRG